MLHLENEAVLPDTLAVYFGLLFLSYPNSITMFAQQLSVPNIYKLF